MIALDVGRCGRCARRRRSRCASSARSIPAKVAGKIVVCDRGVNARVDKSQAVQRARRHRHDPRQHERRTRSTPTCTSCRRSTSTRSLARGREGVRGHRRRDGDVAIGGVSSSPAARSEDGGVLVARSAARRRPATCSSPTSSAPGVDVLAAVSPGHTVATFDLSQRHLDVEPAHRRSRRSAEAGAPVTGRRWRSSPP